MKRRYRNEDGEFIPEEEAGNPKPYGESFPPGKFNLNKALKSISERFEAEHKESHDTFNTELRGELGNRLDPNSADARISRAKEQEKAILEQIAFLTQHPNSALKQNRLYNALNRLSELLAEQGRYDEAIEVCPEQARRDEYIQVRKAIERKDTDTCHCPDEKIVHPLVKDEIIQPAQMVVVDVVSAKHGAVKPLTVCRKCGFAQVK